jgi:phosphate-selective porin OprO/OprP
MYRVIVFMVCFLGVPGLFAENSGDLRLFWNNGLRAETADGAHRFQFGGRFQQDFAVFSTRGGLEEDVEGIDNGTSFRRARLYVAGTFATGLAFRTEYDFAGGSPGFRDLWLEAQGLPGVGNVRLGRMMEPFGLEGTSPNGFFTLIERGLPAAFTPFRNTGVMVRDHGFDRRMTWAAGAFTHTDGFGESVDDPGRSFTGRLTALPVYSEDGRTWWNLGVSGSYRVPSEDRVRYRAKPESHVAPFFADTGLMPADRSTLFGLETAAARGPFSVQAEAVRAEVDTLKTDELPGGARSFQGYYVYGAWMLTGEHRPFSPATASLGRVMPRRVFHPAENGFGAWELAARYSELDLNDGPVRGGRLSNVTLGVNAYLTPNARLSWNWVRADVEDSGVAEILQMRVYVDF